MLYRKHTGYNEFKCIADKCPKSCCIGWQIVIDQDSTEKYQKTEGDFSHRLKTSINYSENCFKQNDGRCAMLNENKLCDLQSTLGENYLCTTCKMFPRHEEEFLDIREYSLSLSCPEVVRMLLNPDFKFAISETQDNLEDIASEYEDYDFILFDKLEFARDKMLKLAAEKAIPLQERMNIIACMALELQNLYDEGMIFEMDDVDSDNTFDSSGTGAMLSLEYCLKGIDALAEMEVLENAWSDDITRLRDYWHHHSTSFTAWHEAMYPDSNLEFIFEKILEVLLFTYFCGSIYDGQIYARTMIAVQSTRWLMMIHAADIYDSLDKAIYLYSREVEHSDININRLIEYFEAEL